MATTTNLALRLDFLGHVQTEQALVENFKKLDALPAAAIPAFTDDDIGNTLGVVDDGEGNAILAWVPAAV